MFCGRNIYWDKYQLLLTASGSASYPGTGFQAAWNGKLWTSYTPDFMTTVDTCIMEIYGQTGPFPSGPDDPTTTWNVQIPEISLNQGGILAHSVTASGSIILEFAGVKLYTSNTGTWELDIATINIYVNGSLTYTQAGWTSYSTQEQSHASIPIIGMFPFFASGGAPSITHAYSPLGHSHTPLGNASGYQNCTFGYRYMEAGSGVWTTPPILLPVSSIAGGGSVSGTNTGAVSTSAFYNIVDTATQYSFTSGNANGQIIPNVPRSLERMCDGYEALVVRYGFPQMGIVNSDFTTNGPGNGNPDGGGGTGVGTTTGARSVSPVYPALTVLEGGVTNATHIIEQPFNYPIYCIAQVELGDVELYPDTFTIRGAYQNFGEDFTPSSTAPYLTNNGMRYISATYINTWVNPHWSFFLKMPPDTAPDSRRWPLNGSPELIDYWEQARQQYISDLSLPPGENTKHRVNVASEPLDQGGLVGAVQTYSGYLSWWWGITGFIADGISFPTSWTLDNTSSARWTFPSGSGSTSAGGVQIAAGSTVAQFALSSFTVPPYNVTELSDRVTVNWTDTNIATCTVALVDADGVVTPIATSPGTYRLPRQNGTKWATSAGEDFGNGYLTDTYTAIAGSDDTSAAMSDPARVVSFNMAPSQSGSYLRFTVTAVNPGNPCTILFPTFLQSPWGTQYEIAETARVGTVMAKDGPLWRYGTQDYINSGTDTLLTTPLVAALSRMPTLGDYVCFSNSYFNGQTALYNLATIFTNLGFENGKEWTITKHFWRDANFQLDTHSFLAPGANKQPVGIMVSSYRAIPPLALDPRPLRTQAGNWQETGTLGCYSYSLVSGRQYVTNPGNEPPQLLNGTSNVLSLLPGTPNGWGVGTYSLPLTNSETESYTLVLSGTQYCSVRPWRGFTNVAGYGGAEKQPCIWTDHGCYHKACINAAGDIVYRAASLAGNFWDTRVTITNTHNWSWPKMARTYYGRMELRAIQTVSGTPSVYAFTSDDEGQTWSSPTLVLNSSPYCTIHSQDGEILEVSFVYDSGTSGPGTFKARFRGPGDTQFSNFFVPKDSTATALHSDGNGFDISKGQASHDPWYISFIVSGETATSDWWCTDLAQDGSHNVSGGTFTRFS